MCVCVCARQVVTSLAMSSCPPVQGTAGCKFLFMGFVRAATVLCAHVMHWIRLSFVLNAESAVDAAGSLLTPDAHSSPGGSGSRPSTGSSCVSRDRSYGHTKTVSWLSANESRNFVKEPSNSHAEDEIERVAKATLRSHRDDRRVSRGREHDAHDGVSHTVPLDRTGVVVVFPQCV